MKPTTQIVHEGGKKVTTYSYVVTLCQKGTGDVSAVRMDGYTSKYEKKFSEDLQGLAPSNRYTVKNILRLYDEDFV